MEHLIELLYDRFNSLFDDLAIGNQMDEDKLAEMWRIFYILHFASYSHSENKELLKVLDYYGR